MGNCYQYGLKFLQLVEKAAAIDLKAYQDQRNPQLRTDYLFGEARGKMFGVMECMAPDGTISFLHSFSGQYNGHWLVNGWVAPLFNVDDWHSTSSAVEKEIKRLTRRINAADGQLKPVARMKKLRKELSQQLMKDIHALYRVTNFRGETTTLPALFPDNNIPTGTGDCCGPKLLGHAAKNNLVPLSMAEFYIGRKNRSGSKHQGQFYSACIEKCQPILGFMLCGIDESVDNNSQQITIIHQESSFVVVDKPGGLLAVPGRGPDKQDCMVNRVKKLIPEMIDQPAVHRLDMYTSGLMILAVDRQAHRELCRQFEKRLVTKRYIAVLDGIFEGKNGTIKLPFRLDPDNRPYQIYDPRHGKLGITHWRKLSIEKGRTRIEFTPVTGRTHQLRVHSSHELGLGTPIAGDRLYGKGREGEQMLLHACSLAFTHPVTGKKLHFDSPVPF